MPDVTSSAGMPPFIGRFRILRVLGSGAQSTVYAAFDPHLHREVALKALHLVGDQTEAATAMLHEARAVSRLSHPAIVPVFDAGEEGGQPYLVFEYVPGQTLAARLHITGSLPAERAVALLLPILEALAYTHEHQVVHRDLKPTNILIDTQGRARVMDFGIAVRQTSVGTTGADADAGGQRALQGTPAYMAPEYARQGIVSPLMDVYSAGLILYEMLCGERAIGEAHGFAAVYVLPDSVIGVGAIAASCGCAMPGSSYVPGMLAFAGSPEPEVAQIRNCARSRSAASLTACAASARRISTIWRATFHS